MTDKACRPWCVAGLSVARVVRVEGRTLVVAGADVVDGSPVLDVKPYLPFCDSLPGATAPAWVRHSVRLPSTSGQSASGAKIAAASDILQLA